MRKRLTAMVLLVVMVSGAVLPPAGYAQEPQISGNELCPQAQPAPPHVGTSALYAGSTCCGVYDSGNPYICCCQKGSSRSGLCSSGETDYVGNCVWYAHHAATWLPSNAMWNCPNCWVYWAQRNGYQTGSTPRANAVAIWRGVSSCDPGKTCSGHVVYVVRDLGNNRMRVQEQNCYSRDRCYSGKPYQERDTSVYSNYFKQNAVFIYPPGGEDTTPPNNPTSITSSSHTPRQWSTDNTVAVQWSGASDPGDPASGIGGYSWAWTRSSSTVPDKQPEGNGNASRTTSPSLANGDSWYFHIRTRDKEGNWNSGAAHLGPFWIDTEPDRTPPNNPTYLASTSHTINQWSHDNRVTVEWRGASDAAMLQAIASGVAGYSWDWTTGATDLPDTIMEVGGSPQTSPALADNANWYFHIRTRDVAGNWNPAAVHLGPFKIDVNPPRHPVVVETGGAVDDVWQNVVHDPAFTWAAADDGNGSGAASYLYYWGAAADGAPTETTATTAFDPAAPASPGGYAARYLRMRTTDNSGLTSDVETVFTFRYDGSAPTGSFTINNGAAVANQVAAYLHIVAADTGSGVREMRLSNDGINWGVWQSYQETVDWEIDAINRTTRTIYLELRDAALNTTPALTQAIYLDLFGGKPRSDNYRILTDVQGRGGNVMSTTNYIAHATVGETIAGAGMAGRLYQVWSGYHGARLANPGDEPPVTRYQMLQSVIGQGGRVKFSGNYRMNATVGQAGATEGLTSGNYRLASGYWAMPAAVGEPEPTETPTDTPEPTATPTDTPEPTATPTSSPTPTPRAEFFGVSVNEAATYSHDYRVTLYLDAPYAVEMMISNDGGFVDAYWEAYNITKTWEIDFYQDYVLPRTVYARFRDANGTIYGNFTDDIIYDPNEPVGEVTITEIQTGTMLMQAGAVSVTLYLDITDDLSGVSEVLVATDDSWETADWENFSMWKTVIAQPGDTIYVFYRDVAGNESLYPLEVVVPGGAEEYEVYLPVVLKSTP